MKKHTFFIIFILCSVPFCADAQPLGSKALRALSKDAASGSLKEASQGALSSAASRGVLSASAQQAAAEAVTGPMRAATDKITTEIVNSELKNATSTTQALQSDWDFIGGVLNEQKELDSFQSQLEASQKRLTRTVLDMANSNLAFCRKDLPLQVEALVKDEKAGQLLKTEASQKTYTKAVNDIMDFGLYGDLADIRALYQAYGPVANTAVGQLLLVPVSRAMVVMGGPEQAEQIILNAPASTTKDKIVAFWQQHPAATTTFFSLDPTLKDIQPVVKDLSGQQMFAFDFSPKATAYWMELSGRVRNSVAAARRMPKHQVQQTGNAGPRAYIFSPLPEVKLAPGSIGADFSATHLNPLATAAAPASAPIKKSVINHLRKNGAFPSGLTNESALVSRWAEDYQNGYFRPRNQIETIEGMSPEKANNVIEYLYYMSTEDAEKIIIDPILTHSRLPDFMYDNKLVPNTQRLPFMYYKNKFNENVKNLIRLADGDITLYRSSAELKDLLLSMKDYTFEQGFAFTNSEELATGLQKKWEGIVKEVLKENNVPTNRALINQLWNEPVNLIDGKKVSLRDYFTQTRPTAFFPQGAMPEFYLNSPKWVAWENVRRDLISNEILPPQPDSFINRIKKAWAGVDSRKYLTLEQFGQLMTSPYLKVYKGMHADAVRKGAVSTHQTTAVAEDHIACIDEQIRQNNFDKIGGVCMSSFGDGGYLGNRDPNYDGTSLRSRYDPVVFDNVKVVVFDDVTLQPKVTTIDKVSYLKDLKKPDPYKEKASRMVGDGIDESRDLLSVQSASEVLLKIPSLRATIRPYNRISYAHNVANMRGGGMAGYLALFTPDFYPIKEVKLLREVDGKKVWVTEYFIRREVVALSGFIHRDRLTFSSQISLRDKIPATPQAPKTVEGDGSVK